MQELSISRHIAASPETVYRVWTTRTSEWFAPRPWTMPVVDYDLRPGGRSYCEMESPEGERMPMHGVFLEVVPNEKIVFTDAFKAGWEPQGPFMVSITEFQPEGDKTLYRATARHWTEETKQRHEAMGFHEGWGKVAEQLAELAEAEARAR